MKLSTRTRNDILAKLRKDLRGKKETWHMVAFEYHGYQVGAKMFGPHAQRIRIESPKGDYTISSMPYSVTTNKAAVEYFGEVLDYIEMLLESDLEN